MNHFFDWLLTETVVEVLSYPVRDRHPLIVLAYWLALVSGIVLVCALIATLVPASPFR